jgi:predicted nucleic acid-binding protein
MRVFIDTAPLIYLCEGTPEQNQAVALQLERWIGTDVTLGSSTMTLLGLLVVPLRETNKRLALKYRTLLKDLLSEPLISLDETIAEAAAEYRARYGFKIPDAIQLATATQHGYDAFYTNDRRLAACADIETLFVNL